MNLTRYCCLFALMLFMPLISSVAKEAASQVLLAQIYKSGIDVTQFLVSEKYDGVRAVWDGKNLVSRQGNIIHSPAWFTKDLPKTPMDGELWLGRGQFDILSAAVRKDVPIDAEWRNITYNIFELPNAAGTFEQRAKHIAEIVKKANLPHLKTVVQFRIKTKLSLMIS